MICVSANKFILEEAQHGRISKDTVNKIRRAWEQKNLPQVLEYHYDQTTQRHLILANFRTIEFRGPFANDAMQLNSAMLSWASLAKEMSIRTFCSADSAIKKQLHDAQRVLEMLGAPLLTCLAFEQLHVKALAVMAKRQRDRWEREQAGAIDHSRKSSNVSRSSLDRKGPHPRRDYSAASHWTPIPHGRNLSEGSFGVIRTLEEESVEEKMKRMNVSPVPPLQIRVRKATGANAALGGASVGSKNSSPSRYGRSYGSPSRSGYA
jgi:hypothetical protein